MAFEYSPYTSEFLESGNSIISDLSDQVGLDQLPTFPNGKQVIFFSLGLVFIIAAVAMMSRTLIAEAAPDIVKAAKTAIL